MSAERCSARSLERGDPLAGTASPAKAFLLLEDAGPWGVKALRDARLPDGLGHEILRRCAEARVRPLLIRRQDPGHFRARATGSAVPTHRRVFAAYVHPRDGFVETSSVGDPRAVLDLDLLGLRAGRSVGLDPEPGPVFAVCTQGRHDVCCAERGRPVAAVLAAVEPEATWQASHLGGDRFAANLLVLDGGLCYGRLDPETVVSVAETHRARRVDLDHLRGRAFWPMPVQAAEIALRTELGLLGLDGVELRTRRRESDTWTSTFAAASRRWEVVVRARRSAPVRLTCHADRAQPSLSWDLVRLSPTPSS